MSVPIIRPIQKKDNPHIANVIRKVLIDLNIPKVGTAYEDISIDDMYNAYQKERTRYFVVEENGKIWGGAGVAPLANYDVAVCELQKMYYLPEVRGKGIGAQMIDICLEAAKNFGFKDCYLETMPYMKAAQKLYVKNGFDYIDGPLGGTGHYSCPVYMLKKI